MPTSFEPPNFSEICGFDIVRVTYGLDNLKDQAPEAVALVNQTKLLDWLVVGLHHNKVLEVSETGGIQKWMVYSGESH